MLLLCPSGLFAQEPLRAGTIFSATQAPLWAAREGRFFEKYGIKNLEVIQFSGGQPVTRALLGGDIQISTTGGAAVVNARLKGADAVIIARTVGVFPYTLYVSKEIRDAADLRQEKTRGQHRRRIRLRGGTVCFEKTGPGSRQRCRPCCKWATLARAWRRSPPGPCKAPCSFLRLRSGARARPAAAL